MTGGGTVIHGWEVTYAIIIPYESGVLPRNISSAYCAISDCLIHGLRQIGIDASRQAEKPPNPPAPFPPREGGELPSPRRGGAGGEVGEDTLPNICLINPTHYDVMLNGKKIAGVSQRRNPKGTMYQGYIALDLPPSDILALASKRPNFDQVVKEKSTAINVERSTPMERRPIEEAVTFGFKTTLDIQLVETELSSLELQSANELVRTKYATTKWNFRR
jgi:lipoate-protein ligase A